MLTGLLTNTQSHLSSGRRSCRQHTHLPAVIGACALSAADTKYTDASAQLTSTYMQWSDHMPSVAGSLRTPTSAADSQQDGGRICKSAPKPQASGHIASKEVRWSHLHARLLEALRRQPHLLPQGSRVLVAVSGGQDSMALLRLLIDLQQESSKHKTAPWPLQLVVGHCDHNMREDSAQNAEFVRVQTLRMGSVLGFGQVSITSRALHIMQIGKSESFYSPDKLMSLSTPLVSRRAAKLVSSGQPQVTELQSAEQSGVLRCLEEVQDSPSRRLKQRQNSHQQQKQQQQQQQHQAELHHCLLQNMLLQQTGMSIGQPAVAAARCLQDPPQQRQQLRKGRKDRQTRLRQNTESAQAESFVHQQADKLGLKYIARTAEQELRSEAEARDWRHRMLAEMAAQAECTHIALGHTATDRAETLLFNMIRGAGPSGVSSMGWHRSLGDKGLQLVRPLLDFTREETAAVCKMTGTEVYEDSTNADVRYSRNRLRLKVLPHLTAINRQAVQHMVQTCELLQADSSFLDSLAELHLKHALQLCKLSTRKAPKESCSQRAQEQQFVQPGAAAEQQEGVLPYARASVLLSDSAVCNALLVEQLQQMPKALRYRVIHSWLQQQPLAITPSYRMVHEIERLLWRRSCQPCQTSTLPSGNSAVLHSGLLMVLHNSTAAGLMSGRLEVCDAVGERHWKQKQPHHLLWRQLDTHEGSEAVHTQTTTAEGPQQQQQQQQELQHLSATCSFSVTGLGRRRRR